MKPDLHDSFIYKDKRSVVDWYDIRTVDQLPEVLWSQVYVVGDLDGSVPIVMYEDEPDSLPGGTPESGETIKQTLSREVKEELNCRVITWQPLGYQKSTGEDQDETYQLRVYAKLEKIGEFTSDPGGSVIGYKLVPIRELNEAIKWGEVGGRIQKLALEAMNSRSHI